MGEERRTSMAIIKISLVCLVFAVAYVSLTATNSSFSNVEAPVLPPVESPIVLELYTSQGCSSCPPADKILESLSHTENLYILSCHVTYWDYIGWKDTLGLNVCNTRQRHFVNTVKGTESVYTPQLVINGQKDFVGTASKKIANAIIAAQETAIDLIALEYADNALRAELPTLQNRSDSYKLRVFLIQKIHTTPIGRGENRNKTINYVQNVKDIYDAGNWNGRATTRMIPLPPHRIREAGADQLIILVKEEKSGTVRAVGRVDL